VKTQISRSIGEPKGLAKKIYNFLAITPDIAANEIFKFINNGDKNRFFYTKKSYLFYKLIRLVLFLFPNIYKGGKN
jgi:hypothetical protein